MKLSHAEIQASARAEAFAMPIEEIDPGTPAYFENDTVGHYFERLRRDDPVHHCNSALYGSYWSVTRFQDIMQVDTNHGIFSSDWTHGGIAIVQPPPGEGQLQMFIAMDPPRHDVQRKAVQPDPRADLQGARQPAARRNLQLG
jgi:cytochrome P450